MIKFNSHIFRFILGLLIINLVFLVILKKSEYTNEYVQYKLNFQTYLLSDSHALPLSNYLEKIGVFNFAMGSESYFDMNRKVRFLIRNTDLERIIISVDDHTLSDYRETSNNLERSYYYTSKEEFSNIFEYIAKKYIINNITWFSVKSRDIIMLLFNSKLSLKNETPTKTEWNELSLLEKIEESNDRIHGQFTNHHKSNSLSASLKDIISICKQNNIEIIGIKFPLPKEFIEALEERSFHADSLFYDNKIKVFDFKYLYINNDNYFSNVDHLNDLGGKLLSEHIQNLLSH